MTDMVTHTYREDKVHDPPSEDGFTIDTVQGAYARLLEKMEYQRYKAYYMGLGLFIGMVLFVFLMAMVKI